MTHGTRWFCRLLRTIYRPVLARAGGQILHGRFLDLEHVRKGRWSDDDVDTFLDDLWAQVDELLPLAELDELPNWGNRHNVFLAVVTTAGYQVMVERDIQRDYAMRLLADVGWKVYASLLEVLAAPFGLTTSDTAVRMQRTLKALMIFPFSAPGEPGYEVEAWAEGDDFYTYWTHCPPQTFVRNLVEQRGDHGELEAFFRSWCQYDWPGADVLADDGEPGHYAREHTLSRGDSICDMCWHGRARPDEADDPRPPNAPSNSVTASPFCEST